MPAHGSITPIRNVIGHILPGKFLIVCIVYFIFYGTIYESQRIFGKIPKGSDEIANILDDVIL